MMRWLLLPTGILMELAGSTCMKLSDGFSNIYASILTFVFWGISFTVFSFAYAIWAGMGILLVSIIGILYFKEPAGSMKVLSIIVIVAGVIMLNLSDVRAGV
ncbi:DMT family transporter [Methanolacinia petrolearia]|uniref:DMT family transporter n=1 Tax=Methanolacinia petrolearia TaxID=54120 RepID=UPI003BAD71D9